MITPQNSSPEPIEVRLAPDQTAVVGYGSLLSLPSLSRTLKRPYDGLFVHCRVEGWRRSWDVAMPNKAFYYRGDGGAIYPSRIIYLNVRPSLGTVMNGVLFVLNAEELEAMHGREWIYDPTVITGNLRGVAVTGGDAIMYVARPEYLVLDPKGPEDAAIRGSYVRLVSEAVAQTDAAFQQEYARSTDPVPPGLVIDDALDPSRPSPWARTGSGYTPQT